VLAAAERGVEGGDSSQRTVAVAIRLEIAIAEAEEAGGEHPREALDPLFRLRTGRWAMADGELGALVPMRDPQLRMLTFDAAELGDGSTEPVRPAARAPCLRHVAASVPANGARREPLFVSDETARILELSDGTRTALEIAAEMGPGNPRAGTRRTLRAIEELFVSGLLWLHEGRIDRIGADPPNRVESA
jgi:hypothetical protein